MPTVANPLRTIRLPTLTAAGQIDEAQFDVFETTAAALSSHIAAASAKLDALSGMEADREVISTEFGQRLQDQATTLTELELMSAPAAQEIIQPAFESVNEVQQRLDGKIRPATPGPQPTEPAGDKSAGAEPASGEPQNPTRDSSSETPSKPIPAGEPPIDTAPATLEASMEHQEPLPGNDAEDDEPSIAPSTHQSENRARSDEAAGSPRTADEPAPLLEPQNAVDNGQSESSSESQPSLAAVEQKEPTRPQEEQPVQDVELPGAPPPPDQPAEPPSAGMQADAASTLEPSTLDRSPQGTPAPDDGEALPEQSAHIDAEQTSDDADTGSSLDTVDSDDAGENQPSQSDPRESKSGSSESKPRSPGK